MNKKLITVVRVMESTTRIETTEEVFPSGYMVNKVIYEMNCRTLLPASDYDISVVEKETSERTEKKPKNTKENSCDLPTKAEKVQRVRKEAAKKKMANLNQLKRGKKKNYTLKDIEEMYALFKKTG